MSARHLAVAPRQRLSAIHREAVGPVPPHRVRGIRDDVLRRGYVMNPLPLCFEGRSCTVSLRLPRKTRKRAGRLCHDHESRTAERH